MTPSLPAVTDLTLIRRIGGGAYGEVWLARTALGTLRAVKIVRRAEFDDDRPYEREFAGIQRFEPISRSHEGFVDLLQVGRNDAAGYFYYVMELADAAGVPGAECQVSSDGREANGADHSSPDTSHLIADTYVPRTLAADVKTHGALPIDECLRIARTLATALAELHRHGLVHRDIKPSNIIFVERVPKLADIGLVAAANEAPSFVGTEGFIPPEGPGTPQADLYSLGILLYVISTGKSHRDFPEPPADLASRTDRERWLEFQAIIHRACQTDPRQRYTSADAMLGDINRMSVGKSVKRWQAAQRRWKVIRRAGASFGFAALVVGGAILAVHQLNRNRPLSSVPRAQILYDEAMLQFKAGAIAEAWTNLNEAVNLDRKFVDAWYKLFETYFDLWGDRLAPRRNQMANFQWVATQLRVLDPNSAQYHTVNSWIQFNEWRFNEAIDEIRLALKRDPNFPRAHGFYGGYMLYRGDPTKARAEFEAAERCDGSDLIIKNYLGTPYHLERNFQKAIELYQRAAQLLPRGAGHGGFLSWAYEADHQYGKALDDYEAAEKDTSQNVAETEAKYTKYRSVLAEKGPREIWLSMVADLRRSKSPDLYGIARLYARIGDTNSAFGVLEEAYQARDGQLRFLLFDDCWDPLRDDPRFNMNLERAGLPKILPRRQ